MKRISNILAIAIGVIGIAFGTNTEDCVSNPRLNQIPFEDLDQKHIIQVHIVPHSFNTEFFTMIDTYFPSQHAELLQSHYDKVFDQVIKALLQSPGRTFSHYETKLFSNWYFRQTYDLQLQIQELVQSGNLEFINGGWDSHEETCPTYQDMLLNLQKGHHFLMDTFNIQPRVAWAVESTGHSLTHPRLLAESGIEALYVLNIDAVDREKRLENKEMEFVWRPHFQHLGRKAEIFTHLIYDFNISPFDLVIEDHPIINPGNDSLPNNTHDQPKNESDQDDIISPDYKYSLGEQEIKKKQQFRSYIQDMSKSYQTRHLLMLVGSNINFEKAEFYLQQLNRTIDQFNKYNHDIKLSFSTLNIYDKMIANDDLELPSSYFDMLPFTDDGMDYYTGLYTSRPNLKSYIRRGSSVIHASNKLFLPRTIDVRDNQVQEDLDAILNASGQLSDIVSSSQTADVVTGICRTGLETQIMNRMQETIDETYFRLGKIIEEYAQTIAGVETKNHQWDWCKYSASKFDCPTKTNYQWRDLVIALYNPSLIQVNITRIPVASVHLMVQAFNSETQQFEDVEGKVLCDIEEDKDDTRDEFEYREEVDRNCILFVHHPIPGQQIGFLTITKKNMLDLSVEPKTKGNFKIENNLQYLQYKQFDEDNGAQFILQKKGYMGTYHIGFDLRFYYSYQGFHGSRSGASIFRPSANDSQRYANLKSVTYYQSEIVSQMTLTFSADHDGKSNVTVKARLYKNDPMIEWDVNMDGIQINDTGKEVTVNFISLDIDNEGLFYTDSNGLEMQERRVNYRPTYKYQTKSFMNVSDNYYPVTSAIAIRDNSLKNQMTVMTTRTQGGSVIKSGRIELMHNRRLVYDDKSTKEIILNELDDQGNPVSVQSTYYLQVFNRQQEKSFQRSTQMKIDAPLQPFFNFDFWKNTLTIKNSAQPLSNRTELDNQGIPPFAKIELIPFNKTLFFVRIENLDDEFDYAGIMQNIEIKYVDIVQLGLHLLKKIYGRPLDSFIMRIAETTLTGNQGYRDMVNSKTHWKAKDDDNLDENELPFDKSKTVISLEPQRIRVFSINLKAPHRPPFNDILGPII